MRNKFVMKEFLLVGFVVSVIILFFLGRGLVKSSKMLDSNGSTSTEQSSHEPKAIDEEPMVHQSLSETPFADQLLTEEMAIKYTRQELVNKGYDVSVLKPVEYWHDYPEGFAERVFARNRISGKENEGYVLWGPKDPGDLLWIYKVSIVKQGSQIKCKVRRAK